MMPCLRVLVPIALIVLDAGLVRAESAGGAAGHGPDWMSFFAHVFNLAVLSGLLVYFAGPALREFLRNRATAIREDIEGAQARLQRAEVEIAELRNRLADFDDEAAALGERASQSAGAEKQRVLDRSRQTADRIREDARRIADQEIARARQELRGEAAALATDLAADLLRERTSRDDNDRLVDEFTRRIGDRT